LIRLPTSDIPIIPFLSHELDPKPGELRMARMNPA